MTDYWIALIILVVLTAFGVALYYYRGVDKPEDEPDLGDWMESQRWDK